MNFMKPLPISTSNDMTLAGICTALGLCIMFGSNVIAIKISLHGLGVYFNACIRFVIASVCLFAWAKFTGQSLRVKREHLLPIVIISITFSLQLLLIFTGLSKTTAARSSLFSNLQPFFVLVLAHFFIPGDRINLRKLLGMTLAFMGIVSVFLDNSGLNENFRSGDILVLCGAFVWGCNAVYTKHVIHHFKPIQVALFPMIASIPISLFGSIFWDPQPWKYIDTTIILSLAYQSVVVAAFGYVAWNSLLSRYGAVAVHSFIFVLPIIGVLLGGLILDEPITPKLLLGLVLLVSGLLVIHLKQKKQPPIFPAGRNV